MFESVSVAPVFYYGHYEFPGLRDFIFSIVLLIITGVLVKLSLLLSLL